MPLQALTADKVPNIRFIELPAFDHFLPASKFVEGRCVAADARTVPCIASALKTRAGRVTELQCDCGIEGIYIVTRVVPTAGLLQAETSIVQVGAIELADGTTIRCKHSIAWVRHPLTVPDMWKPATISATWRDAVRMAPDAQGRGLRSPQIGALHALAAHSTLGERTALVVMPTGTGKTEVMLAHMVMTSPNRLLVLVPSDALRSQTYEKFISLGILHRFSVVGPLVRRPVTAVVKKGFRAEADFSSVLGANVVVSTVAMLATVPVRIRKAFLDQFDTVYFDEAHHLRADTWEQLYEQMEIQRVIAFTATPYREDGKRIPLRIVYNFPLKLAQEQQYFRKIDFLEVDSSDRDEADREIARLAVERLRADEARGNQHIILARADDRKRAQHLYETIYRPVYSDLNPVVIYTGLSGRKETVRAIRHGNHRIVVCVDMFGEGFDLPALKIAAMHDVHRSLAITLQFTGRFTRDGPAFGDATLVANIAEPKVSDAIEELYAEDPDWNLLIPQLSARAVQTELDFAEFLARLPRGHSNGEKALFDLNVMRPKTSTVVYRTSVFSWRKFKAFLKGKKGTRLHYHWPSTDQNLLVFVTRTRSTIEWARIHETQNETWDLFVLAYDAQLQLLFIHSSQKGATHSELAKAVTNDTGRIIDGETPFKVLHGINRVVLYNVGLYGRGKLRFRMLTGLDIAEAISAATQATSTKANVFGAGYADGKRVTVGASAKGRIWSMSASSIPDWLEWCRRVGAKLNDPNLRANMLLNHTMVATALTSPPDGEVFAVLPSEDWLEGDSALGKLLVGGRSYEFWEATFGDVQRTADRRIEFSLLLDGQQPIRFRASWGPEEAQYALEQIAGTDAMIRIEGTEQQLRTHLLETPVVLMMIDGSEVRAGKHLKSPSSIPYTYPAETIIARDWTGTSITEESKWKFGVQRSQSVQGAIIAQLINENNRVVFDDDDAGESADIVEIAETNGLITIKLYHCKYSGGDHPGVRVEDLYVVCGQAVRSARLAHNPVELLRHLERRERTKLNGRPTRFEKGDLKTLASVRRLLRKHRARFEFTIVQPGLSKAALPAEKATILGAADIFLRETMGTGLKVIASQ